jgi:hypothetical protein
MWGVTVTNVLAAILVKLLRNQALFSQEIKLHLKRKKRVAGFLDIIGYNLSLVNLNRIESQLV